ncbi:response regulator transcription factor [Vibrio ulleungensis]|uniref:Response regulator transcription factor n=1 Tax=Vibrio ulleungensis TaxID=2807619 RepID=A0ABS2HJ21_9VIBR|nr:response regulator transcription factor [Vibrio ulleungensis]MBM7037029.1 response regulator transcription factor [Vibrio ulleungensis]
MKILIVEDDQALSNNIAQVIEENGWTPDVSFDGIDALYRATSEEWDLIILDLGLPKLDGMTVLKSLRNEEIHTPVIILSARGALSERVEGLNSGADDYVTKPFENLELIARVRTHLRRASGNTSPVISLGDLSLDTRSSKVLWQGEAVALTALEYKVVAYFVHNSEKVISRTELVEHIYKQDFDRDSNTIEVFIGRIRKKISPKVFQTVRGLGYRLNVDA